MGRQAGATTRGGGGGLRAGGKTDVRLCYESEDLPSNNIVSGGVDIYNHRQFQIFVFFPGPGINRGQPECWTVRCEFIPH